MKSSIVGVLACVACGLPTAGLAQDLKAEQRFEGTTVVFNVPSNVANLSLSVAGPVDFHASASARSGSPIIDLRRLGAVEDGAYTYQLSASTDEKVRTRADLDNGRGNKEAGFKSVATSGTFQVRNGVIVPVKPQPPLTSDPKSRQDQQ
jgi:hypothetical protein